MDNQQGKVTAPELAWLAGFIDGEGTITLSDRRYLNKRISPHVMVTNTHFPSLDRVVEIMKGIGINAHVLQRPGNAAKSWSAAGTVELSGFARTKTLLSAIQPYLVTKARQADIVLRFIDRRLAQARLDPVTIQDLDALRQVRALNRRGVTTLTDYTRDVALEARTCKQCGKAYQPVQKSQIYCSVRCRHGKYVTFGPPRECPHCHKMFEVQRRPEQVYCSTRCRMVASQARYRARQAAMV